ncbi:MAG TPA: DAK2 domain-containing protein, partial [Actinomycetota bacterium]|nr:DAK2 domain-containing protein [Actinomycetota bacterium]
LDSLNVFPVPDGDTGTNLLLTMRGVMAELGPPPPPPREVFAATVADAALMSARGNSGVILAQALRAIAGLATGTPLDDALASASLEARRAVARPLEGTVLTVLADAAAAAAGAPPARVATAARDAAAASLERTTALRPELAEAGVVDAGGLGALLLLDALASVAAGGQTTVAVGAGGPVGRADLADVEQDVGFKFEVMFLLRADDGEVAGLREGLDELGDSLVVVGGDGRYRVHLHTDEPDAAVELAAGVGTAEDVRMVDLEEEVAERCVAGQARGVRVAERQTAALVAVASGSGMVELFRSLGAVVVSGDAGRPPEIDELVAAIEAAPAGAVVVLPNADTAIAVAERAAGASGKDVWVVPARTVAEGLSAAAAFNPTEPPDDAADRLADAVAAVATASLIRSSEPEGDWLGMVGGEAVVREADLVAAAVGTLRTLRNDDHEMLTMLLGADATEEDASGLADALASTFPDLQLEVHRGNQPGDPYLFGLE